MNLPAIDSVIGLLQVVFRSKEESALLALASAADEMLEDIKARPSVTKFWAALQSVSAIEAAKAPPASSPYPTPGSAADVPPTPTSSRSDHAHGSLMDPSL